MARLWLEYLHVIGAVVAIGAGLASAVLMVAAHAVRDPARAAAAVRMAMVAHLFTSLALAAELVSGVLLARAAGYALTEGWIVVSIMVYILAAALWLPASWIQRRLGRLAQVALAADRPLPALYRSLLGLWLAVGVFAFGAVLAILWLMIARPAIVLW